MKPYCPDHSRFFHYIPQNYQKRTMNDFILLFQLTWYRLSRSEMLDSRSSSSRIRDSSRQGRVFTLCDKAGSETRIGALRTSWARLPSKTITWTPFLTPLGRRETNFCKFKLFIFVIHQTANCFPFFYNGSNVLSYYNLSKRICSMFSHYLERIPFFDLQTLLRLIQK